MACQHHSQKECTDSALIHNRNYNCCRVITLGIDIFGALQGLDPIINMYIYFHNGGPAAYLITHDNLYIAITIITS